MTKLKELSAYGVCEINDNSIKNLNLELLDVDDNNKISDVNHMTNLRVLLARFNCGIDDEGIKKS